MMLFWPKKTKSPAEAPRTPETPHVELQAPGSILSGATNNTDTQNFNALILSAIHDGVILISGDGNIRLANPAALLLLGKKAEEVVGLNYASSINLVDKQNRSLDESENPITLCLKNRKDYQTRSLSLRTADSGNICPVSLVLTPTSDANGSIILTLRNIAEELKQENERSDFISTASHEMRTPVASIEGYLSLAINPATATVDARALSYLEKAHAASQHLGRLFRDLLDTTRLDDGHLQPNFQPVELVSLTKQSAEACLPMLAPKKLALIFDDGIKNDDTSSAKHLKQIIYARVDPDFFTEIINNLIENAVKYTPAGGKITIAVQADASSAQISIADTGIGISNEDAAHIFQKFYRADNRDTREIGGTGLGLYLVKQRVEAMAGKIFVKSSLGQGSTFFVVLPRISSAVYDRLRFAQQNSAFKTATPTEPTAPAVPPAPAVSDTSTNPTVPAEPATSATPVTSTTNQDTALSSPDVTPDSQKS